MKQYAVNLVAFMNVSKQPEHLPLAWLLNGVTTETVVHCSEHDRLGTEAVLIREDVTEERWQAIVKVVQMKFRPTEFPLYENAGKGWTRIAEKR